MNASRYLKMILSAVSIIAISAGFFLIIALWNNPVGTNTGESAIEGSAMSASIQEQAFETPAVTSANMTAVNTTTEVTLNTSSADSLNTPTGTETVESVIEKTNVTPEVSPHAPDSAKPSDIEDSQKLSALKYQILDSIGKLDSIWDIYVERLSDRSSITCSTNLPKDGRMVSASLIKIFIMGAVYEQLSLGTIDEDLATPDLEIMITVSNNDATNRLIKLLGGGDSALGFNIVNEFSKSLGCEHTELNRLMLDWDENIENYTSSSDCAKFLNLIYSGKCINDTYSTKMMTLLKAQEKNEGLKWPIPKDVIVASKPGYISEVSIGDVGIVFTEKTDYIICIICNNPNSNDGAKQEISDISKLVYDYFAL